MLASYYGFIEIVRELISQKSIDINSTNVFI